MVNKLSDQDECPLDLYIFNFIDIHLHHYYNIGFSPNMVTTFSFLFGLLSAQQILKGHFNLSIGLLLVSYYLDCVDGKLARQYNMVTHLGDIYDHVGDLLKIIAIIAALFASNTKKTTNKQWLYITCFALLTFIQCIHLGYQETIYNKQEESSFLNIWRKIVAFDHTPEKTIQCTKYLGCGTWYLCFALLIFFWRK
jgi:phosphatidylglycerophosphate synthase